MEDACSERRIGFAGSEDINEVRDGAGATGSDNGDADGLADSRGECAIESGARTIGVHRSKENLACATRLGFTRPLDHSPACWLPSTLHEDLRVAGRIGGFWIATRIDGNNDSLRAKTSADGIDEGRIGKGGGIDADFVGPCVKDLLRISGAPNSSTNGEGHKKHAGSAANRIEQRLASFVRCSDVEQNDFVRALVRVARGKLGWIARINDVDKLDAFDDAAGVDIEARDDALG